MLDPLLSWPKNENLREVINLLDSSDMTSRCVIMRVSFKGK